MFDFTLEIKLKRMPIQIIYGSLEISHKSTIFTKDKQQTHNRATTTTMV
jgi:hypothetical protein